MKNYLFALPLILLSNAVFAADFSISLSPAQHNHPISEVVNLQSSLDAKASTSSLGTHAFKSSLLESDIPAIPTSKVSGLSSTISSALIPYQTKTEFAAISAPTIRKFQSVATSQTYTTPIGVKWLKIRLIGGGGGGGSSGTNSGIASAGSGNPTSFGPLSANGGIGGGVVAPGLGGSATLGAVADGIALSGNNGGYGNYEPSSAINLMSGIGASSPFGSGGGSANTASGVGVSALANTGAGGGGASKPAPMAAFYSGSGGGSGGYIEAIIPAPLATYTYSVGSGGAPSAAGPNGAAGGSGGSGLIIIEEHYQ